MLLYGLIIIDLFCWMKSEDETSVDLDIKLSDSIFT